MRVQLHIIKRAGGQYSATLDDIDHGKNGIPVSSFSADDRKMSFAVESISLSYEGRLNADGSAIEGTWSQNFLLPLTFRRLKVPFKLSHKPSRPSDIDGTWEGVIAEEKGARLVFHLTNTEDGLTATVDSPDQNISGWPVPVVTRNDSNLKLEMRQVSASFVGKISSDLTTINGSWEAPGAQWPLVLRRRTKSP